MLSASFTTKNGMQILQFCVCVQVWAQHFGIRAQYLPDTPHSKSSAQTQIQQEFFIQSKKFLWGENERRISNSIELISILAAETTMTTTTVMMMSNPNSYAQMPPSYSTTVHNTNSAVSDRNTKSILGSLKVGISFKCRSMI